MKKQLHLLTLIAFLLFGGCAHLFYREYLQLHSRGKTELKKHSEQFFLEFEQKTAYLDQLAHKSHLGQLSKQTWSWPTRVDYIDGQWKILSLAERAGYDQKSFTPLLKNKFQPTWLRISSPLTNDPLYYRAFPLPEGGWRIFEVSRFEEIFFSRHTPLKLSFLPQEKKPLEFPFFPSLEMFSLQTIETSLTGYTMQSKKSLEGLFPPLLVSIHCTFPPLLLLSALFSLATLGYLWLTLYKTTAKTVFYPTSTLFFLLISLWTYHKKNEALHYEKALQEQHAHFFVDVGVQNYLTHIEQLGKILHTVFAQNQGESLDTAFFQKWPYLEKTRFINHTESLIFEKSAPQFSHPGYLNTLFLKSSGWIFPDAIKSAKSLVYYITLDDCTLILQASFDPILAPLETLKKETGITCPIPLQKEGDCLMSNSLIGSRYAR